MYKCFNSVTLFIMEVCFIFEPFIYRLGAVELGREFRLRPKSSNFKR